MTIELIWEGDRAPFAKAFVAAQKATEAVKKAAVNDAFKRGGEGTRYAMLADVVEAVVPALNNAGIGVIQSPGGKDGKVYITTVLIHESGASVTGVLELQPSKADPQGYGSAITYGRRYALLAMTGAAPEDDDGNAASGPRQAPSPPPLSTGARLAINTMESYQRDREMFAEFWTKNKEGLKANLDGEEYAVVVAAMKRIGASFPPVETAKEPAKQANGHQAAVDILAGDEIPF